MKDTSFDVKFMVKDSQVGDGKLESTLALVNNTEFSDEDASRTVTQFLNAYDVDFHSEDDRDQLKESLQFFLRFLL